MAERQGSYRSEAVRPTLENAVITKAAAQGAGVMTAVRTNVQDLARRVQQDPPVTTASLYETLAELPEIDKTALPRMFEFIDGLAELAGGDTAHEHLAEDSEPVEGADALAEQEAAQVDSERVRTIGDREGSRGGGDGEGQARDEEDLESKLTQALGKFGSTTDKATAVALARGYFESRGANPLFLNMLSLLSAKLDGIVPQATLAQVIAAQEALLAAESLETSPAAVRRRYRKRLRERKNLGELFEELVEIGLESSLSALLTEIGSDLAGVTRQSDRAFLRSLTSELKKLWQLRSAWEDTREMLRLTEPHLPRVEWRPEPVKLTLVLLLFCAKPVVGPSDSRALLGPVANAALASQVVFANGLMDLHSRLPDGIWSNAKERMLQHLSLGALCQRLTEEEERLYEEASGASAA
ncbi:hypothetical protein [Bradyrhizobium sp. CCBAU 53351]|uniref:hypothetical protein n=1 Tax=Bradyrhizobium sp. CCBAU 53351 TaxID=1325114 RepID=UPI00188761A5|nr:hypothetical protein [Bradyrhizobium sp. CCBAU 53351]